MTCYGQRDDETEEQCNARRAREAEEAMIQHRKAIRESAPYKLLLSSVAKGNGNTLTTILLIKNLKQISYDVTDAIDLLLIDSAK